MCDTFLLNLFSGIDYSSSEFAIISTRGTEDLDIDDSLQLTSKDNVRLTLRINGMYVVCLLGDRGF